VQEHEQELAIKTEVYLIVHPLKTMPGLYLIRLVCRKESPRSERIDPSVRGRGQCPWSATRQALITPLVPCAAGVGGSAGNSTLAR